ncbi:BgTH12-07196 [Blumeria graminis f. sp. triticale]|uniref:BgTH12-07196 n=1 Tax=Blumeria graminis f. sp. triticale TaxID=1689686 RepID=A0A9W4D933_BLUGR|nr:BgTH12-07196 [Blumeria graminis f. sp. triticale]
MVFPSPTFVDAPVHQHTMIAHDSASLTMSTLMAVPSDILRLTTNQSHIVASGLDSYGQELTFERRDSDGHQTSLPSLPFTPSYDKSDGFSSTFDDPFPYQNSTEFASSHTENKQGTTTEPKSSSAEMDNKLLGFSGPILKAPIFDDNGQTWPIMSAELYGMFFVAEDVYGDSTATGNELTCYRRNLFQISGAIILSRGTKGMINEQGLHIPFFNLEASLTAFESIEGKSTEIISVPWKTATGVSSEDKAGTAPPSHQLDLSLNPDMDPTMLSIPISWKRLQFKHATANNGRRKGLQQHYIVQVNLVATLSTGELFRIAEIQSGPIIVRGRSPRNFDSKIRESEKKSDTKPSPHVETDMSTPRTRAELRAQTSAHGSTSESLQSALDLSEWKANVSRNNIDHRPTKKQSKSPESAGSTISPVLWNSESVTWTKPSLSSPIDISPGDEENCSGYSLSHCGNRKSSDAKNSMDRRRGVSLGSLIESADFLYEYFPLTVDDWMPPVDAIYRPHVVHHQHYPREGVAQQTKHKRKTYFSAED